MGRVKWAILLGADAILAAAVYAFGSTQVAPCLAGSGTAPDIQERCAAAWFASRPLELQLLDTPIPAILLFVALVALTAWISRRSRPTGERRG